MKYLFFRSQALLLNYFLIFVVLLLLQNCKRSNYPIESEPLPVSQVRSWLHNNGLQYKNETITIKTSSGKLVTGQLNWKNANQYPYEGKDYIDIPLFLMVTGRRFRLTEVVPRSLI